MKRTFLIIALFLFAFTATAQEQKVSLEKKGDLVEATYYHDNGKVAQTGTFKNEKLHGQRRRKIQYFRTTKRYVLDSDFRLR